MRKIFVVAGLLVSAPAIAAPELAEIQRKEPRLATSAKAPKDIEWCVAVAMNELGQPTAFRDGDKTILVLFEGGRTVRAMVTLIPAPTGSKIEMRTMSSPLRSNQKVIDMIMPCF